ncbi:OLC1v1010146C1 [Oldenlandia corymbosa var. corymbosa]|uniref:OLC1v1010146C1 n=1 Tax=Oldenlandia corymbosa var. corymbosa TaxID=529605 RepID=A0AAV1DT17_OLDCO|nr:OLC1v1010146C1 [Oldenlandia corymbosa var. corymbosa]
MATPSHILSSALVPPLHRPYTANSFSPTSPLPRFCSSRKPSSSVTVAKSQMMDPQTKFTDFPHASAPVKELMLDLMNSVETRIGSSLLPCSLPPDVQFYENSTGTAQGTLLVRSGIPSSPVDFILGSWVHCKLPSGEALNITSLSTYMKPLTDAPNFIVEIIQGSPTSLVVILDMPPRKDLVLHPEYLKTFYEDTQLDMHRQLLEKLPEVTPYITPSLYIRALVSPSAILVRIAEGDKTAKIEEIIQDQLRPISNEIMKVWLDTCASGGRPVEKDEMACLAKRDQVTRSKSIEIDLGTSLPRLFGEEVAGRVLQALEGTFNA